MLKCRAWGRGPGGVPPGAATARPASSPRPEPASRGSPRGPRPPQRAIPLRRPLLFLRLRNIVGADHDLQDVGYDLEVDGLIPYELPVGGELQPAGSGLHPDLPGPGGEDTLLAEV